MTDKKKNNKTAEALTPVGVGGPTDSVRKEDQEEGRDLCPKCGNIMIDEGGDKVCSSCSGEIDFFGEDEEDIEKKPK